MIVMCKSCDTGIILPKTSCIFVVFLGALLCMVTVVVAILATGWFATIPQSPHAQVLIQYLSSSTLLMVCSLLARHRQYDYA